MSVIAALLEGASVGKMIFIPELTNKRREIITLKLANTDNRQCILSSYKSMLYVLFVTFRTYNRSISSTREK